MSGEQVPQWTRDGRKYSAEYRTWRLRVWPVGDGRWLFCCELIWIQGNESEMLTIRGCRASSVRAKAAAIARVDHRGGEAMS